MDQINNIFKKAYNYCNNYINHGITHSESLDTLESKRNYIIKLLKTEYDNPSEILDVLNYLNIDIVYEKRIFIDNEITNIYEHIIECNFNNIHFVYYPYYEYCYGYDEQQKEKSLVNLIDTINTRTVSFDELVILIKQSTEYLIFCDELNEKINRSVVLSKFIYDTDIDNIVYKLTKNELVQLL
jgi:hypothetical protein